MKLTRIASLLLGIALMGFGGFLVQNSLEHRESGSRGKQTSLFVFVGGIYFLAKAAIPGDDDQD